MKNNFQEFHGAIRIYKGAIEDSNDILIKLIKCIDKSKIWKWRSSGQAIYTKELQRKSIDAILPSFYSDYSSLELSEDDKDLISFSHYIHKITKEKVLEYANYFGINIDRNEKSKLIKYSSGDFFTLHRDDHPITPRTFSTILYLNDNYVGGDLYFKYFDFKYKPGKGDLIIFPSNYPYSHESIKIESGNKYAIVDFWLESVKHER